jgi:precorrin-6x reductase
MVLSEKVLEKLSDDSVRMKICLELNIAYVTLRRWTSLNHRNITRKDSIDAIVKHTGISENEIFEPVSNDELANK